jgi:hypothetical protein
MRALSSDGQAAPMTDSAIASEIHQALDRLLLLAPEITLNLKVLIDNLADPHLIVCRQIIAFDSWIDIGFGQNFARGRPPDPKNVGKRDLNALVSRQLDTGYSCHRTILPLSLTLLVAWIHTQNPDDALAAHHLAILANLLD